MLAAVLVLLVGAAINYLVALRLNSAKTQQGRQWHPSGRQHTLWGMPMQDWSGVIVAMALVAVAIGVGVLVAPLAGWLTFAGMLVAAVTSYTLWRRRAARRRAQLRDRARPMDPREREFVETTMNALFGKDRASGPRQRP